MSPCPRKGCSMPHLSWSRQEVHALRRHLEALGRKIIGNLRYALTFDPPTFGPFIGFWPTGAQWIPRVRTLYLLVRFVA